MVEKLGSNKSLHSFEYRPFCKQLDFLEKQSQNNDRIFYKNQNELFYKIMMIRSAAFSCLAIGMSGCLILEYTRKGIIKVEKKIAEIATSILSKGVDILKDSKSYAIAFSILAAGSLIYFSSLYIRKIFDGRKNFMFGYDTNTKERTLKLNNAAQRNLILIDSPKTDFTEKNWAKKPKKLLCWKHMWGSSFEKEVFMLILEARHCRINEKIASIREECNILENDVVTENASYLWKNVNDKCLHYVHQLKSDEKNSSLIHLRSVLPRFQEYKNQIEHVKENNGFGFDTFDD